MARGWQCTSWKVTTIQKSREIFRWVLKARPGGECLALIEEERVLPVNRITRAMIANSKGFGVVMRGMGHRPSLPVVHFMLSALAIIRHHCPSSLCCGCSIGPWAWMVAMPKKNHHQNDCDCHELFHFLSCLICGWALYFCIPFNRIH